MSEQFWIGLALGVCLGSVLSFLVTVAIVDLVGTLIKFYLGKWLTDQQSKSTLPAADAAEPESEDDDVRATQGDRP